MNHRMLIGANRSLMLQTVELFAGTVVEVVCVMDCDRHRLE